jgi:hypothetical protein
MRINIDSKELKNYTKTLANISRKSVPKAVRSTLNDAAFDVKKTTLPASIKQNFDGLKAPQFFKRFSGVDKATGTDMNSMQSVIGFVEMGNPAARRAIQNLDKQEIGGIIEDGLSYLKGSRRGNKSNGFVKKENYYDKSKIVSGRSTQGRNKGTNKSKFVARAYRANKEGKPMFLNTMKGNFVAKVNSFKKSRKGKIKIKLTLLMKERETVKIKSTHFMEEAATMTQQKMERFYIKNAEYWLNKLQK